MDFVEQLKSSIDIVKVIGEYVRLDRKGATGRFSGLCPFHQEKTPSFSVHQQRQFYKCFGCGASGDVLKFVMEHDGLTFPETLRSLSERFGIPMPQRNEYSDADSRLRAALFEMHEIAADVFRDNLRGPVGADARAYLEKRGISQELVEVFGLGYSDTTGQALMRRFTDRKFSTEQLEASGLVRKRNEGPGHFDAFRGRLMFPIHNESGKVIGFGGRAMRDEDQPKYLNSPETAIYKKTTVLYNLHRARDGMRKQGRTVLVEGYMDVIGVYAAGIREVVASCGTALTNQQVRAMHRHADAVILNFDPDTAGENAAERAIQLLLDEGLQVRVLSLGGGEPGSKLDPDEYVKRFGANAYVAKLDSAASYFHWMADRARGKFDMRSAEGRVSAFKFLLPVVKKVPDKLERAAVVSDLASYLGVDQSMVLDQFKKDSNERRPAAPTVARVAVPASERILLEALLSSSRVRQEILPQLQPELLEGFLSREIIEAFRHVDSEDPARVFADVEGRLTESGRALLHEAIATDHTEEGLEEDFAWNQATACLERLQSDFRKRRLADLKAQVKVAEREGRVGEAMTLYGELEQLERALRSRAS
ncbi:MAG: DNA primase [Bryobacteraceae bacterium]